jgi:hypothetical protein
MRRHGGTLYFAFKAHYTNCCRFTGLLHHRAMSNRLLLHALSLSSCVLAFRLILVWAYLPNSAAQFIPVFSVLFDFLLPRNQTYVCSTTLRHCPSPFNTSFFFLELLECQICRWLLHCHSAKRGGFRIYRALAS